MVRFGGGIATKRPQGQYRTEPTRGREPMAYVLVGHTASYVTETAYREKKYEPTFDQLPTEEEYDA
jgi:hypothetical protein